MSRIAIETRRIFDALRRLLLSVRVASWQRRLAETILSVCLNSSAAYKGRIRSIRPILILSTCIASKLLKAQKGQKGQKTKDSKLFKFNFNWLDIKSTGRPGLCQRTILYSRRSSCSGIGHQQQISNLQDIYSRINSEIVLTSITSIKCLERSKGRGLSNSALLPFWGQTYSAPSWISYSVGCVRLTGKL
ncbi:hypothetical protein BT96DRAFT_83678 [Gymnopus androsaceus JB14]|uniref:Uncharacterized protein n=1 Tax=Gymnopus androsaceus JB14 TaxID=1447944 RepID=A0A6A4IGI8_9AGAR|nr:hypothetical protein BT96DRAFT_83678 [Gymnopus androsaceus JB14]